MVIAPSFFRKAAERLEPIGSVDPYPYSPNHEHRKDEGDGDPFGELQRVKGERDREYQRVCKEFPPHQGRAAVGCFRPFPVLSHGNLLSSGLHATQQGQAPVSEGLVAPMGFIPQEQASELGGVISLLLARNDLELVKGGSLLSELEQPRGRRDTQARDGVGIRERPTEGGACLLAPPREAGDLLSVVGQVDHAHDLDEDRAGGLREVPSVQRERIGPLAELLVRPLEEQIDPRAAGGEHPLEHRRRGRGVPFGQEQRRLDLAGMEGLTRFT